MIKLDGNIVDAKHFPDGSQMLLDLKFDSDTYTHRISWLYENDEEIVRLYYIVSHIKEMFPECKINLDMPYINSARMDRVKANCEVFTLKHFAKLINSMGFSRVYVYDPHSNVSEALIDRICVTKGDLKYNIGNVLSVSHAEIVYFPDESAMKRYNEFIPSDIDIVYGKKNRDWKTGEIKGIDIVSKSGENVDITDKNIVVIDDIISKGGSIYYGMKAMLDGRYGCKPESVSIYASHIENSMYGEKLWNMCVENKWDIWTTNSIVHSEEIKSNLRFNEITFGCLKY